MLEQPFDNLSPLFDLEGKRALRQAGRGRGAEEVRPLERPVGFGQAIQLRIRRPARTSRSRRRRSQS